MLLAWLPACGIAGEEPPASLVGIWLMMQEGSSFPLSCNSSRTIQYYSDGTYRLFAEVGTWRLEGKVLTETATYADRTHLDVESVEISRPYTSTIEWIDRDRFHKKFRDESVSEFRRCTDSG